MKLHHGAHHKTYVTNLNNTYEQYQSAESKTDVPKMIQLQQAIKFNGGGRSQFCRHFPRHIHGQSGIPTVSASALQVADSVQSCCVTGHVNHSIFWQNLTPPKVG